MGIRECGDEAERCSTTRNTRERQWSKKPYLNPGCEGRTPEVYRLLMMVVLAPLHVWWLGFEMRSSLRALVQLSFESLDFRGSQS